MSAKDNRHFTAHQPAARPSEKSASPALQPNVVDPIDAANHLWALRLWMLCALIVVAFAVSNYLLHWFI